MAGAASSTVGGAGVASGQSVGNTTGGNTSASGSANGSESPSTSAVGEGRVVPCSEVQQNTQGSGGPNYRIVRGGCSIELSDGDVLSNVWFRGGTVEIRANGAGWTIRNVAVTGHDHPDDPPFNLRVDSRGGLGYVGNVWVSEVDSNVLFVHASHRGIIRFNKVSFVNTGEDAAYASRPANPKKIAPVQGGGGIVGFNQAFVKGTGLGPKNGYGLRLGSDGSFVTNSTIVDTTGPAAANTFAGGELPTRHPQAFPGVLFRHVDIVTDATGIRLNNHQDGIAPRRRWTSITYLQDVAIDSPEPIQRNEAGGVEPIIRGTYSTDADPSPPPGAPRSPERAASGVGGGTGPIGGAVSSLGGPQSGPGRRRGFVAVVGQTVALLVLGVVGAIVAFALAAIAWLERDGSDNGGRSSGGEP